LKTPFTQAKRLNKNPRNKGTTLFFSRTKSKLFWNNYQKREENSPTFYSLKGSKMSRPCFICRHPNRAEIDAAVIAKIPYAEIAKNYHVSKSGITRHKAHLTAQLSDAVGAVQKREERYAENLLDQVENLRQRTMSILDAVEAGGSYAVALQAVREARACLELLGKISGKLTPGTNVNVAIYNTPEWGRLMYKIIGALKDYPEARERLINILGGVSLPPPALLVDSDVILREQDGPRDQVS
jgi:hypothetical protein